MPKITLKRIENKHRELNRLYRAYKVAADEFLKHGGPWADVEATHKAYMQCSLELNYLLNKRKEQRDV